MMKLMDPAKLKVTILASEWGSSKGGLSTINRELAIQLAKFPDVEITFFVPNCCEEDKKEALSHNVHILNATRRPGFEELEWLSFPPEHLQIDIVVGHGMKLGRQAQVIRDYQKCKWVQVVHTDPEELGMFKSYSKPISKGEEKHKIEVELCEIADFVVGVGPKLTEAFRSYLRWCKKDQTVVDFTPGIFAEFLSVQQVLDERKHCRILAFGRGDAEDFSLKGFDIAARAVATLPDTHLVFVGAPDGKHEEIAERLLQCGIPASRLKVRGYVENRESLKRLFCEVDLVLMPSRTEGFGLTGLEALSAGLPVLVSGNSGFGEALTKVPLGSSFVIDSEDPEVWATAIKELWEKDRRSRLDEAEALRISYEKTYSWSKQSKDLVDKMMSVVQGTSCKTSTHKKGETIPCSVQASQQTEGVTVTGHERRAATRIFDDLHQMHCDTDKVKKTNLSVDLAAIASDEGFKISDNPASGNCMFYALSEQLQSVKGICISQGELRRTLVRFLTVNSSLRDGTPLFNFVSGYPSWPEYLGSMEKDGTWGDHLVLLAAANCYRTHIRVISSLGRDVFISPELPTANTIPLVLGHIHEEHYVSLQPKQDTFSRSHSSRHSKFEMSPPSQACQGSEDMTEHNSGPALRFTSVKNRTNYARLCQLLVSIGSRVLEGTFNRIIPPKNLESVLKRHPAHSKLQSLRKEGILDTMQWRKLYPAVPSLSSTGFDPALLMILLRTICNLSPPPAGWDAPPLSADTSCESDIARVKYFMNAVSNHAAETSVSDEMFTYYWQQIRDTLVRLGGAGYEVVIDEMENQEMDPLDEEHFIELLKQWKSAEDGIKEKLNEVERVLQCSKKEDVSHPTHIIERIRLLYKTREERLLPVPWCEDFSFHLNDMFTRLKIVGKEKTRGTLNDEITNMTGIFKAHKDCQKPRTVLIEGEPGIGKTTYCQKLAYDWATKQEEWDESFPEIEVLLLLRCHDITSDIWEAIDEQLLPEDVDNEAKENFFKFIRENQSKVLLVLDGLDEADPSKLAIYINLAESKVLPDCHIVLTSRHEAGQKVGRYCDTLWEIVGFTEEDARNFILKYFKNMEHLAEKLLEKLRPSDELSEDWETESGDLTELSTNPMNTALLCVLCEDFEGVFPTNRTQLYIEIVRCILRRYEKKSGLSSNNEDLITVYKEELMHLGRLALKSLLKRDLYIEGHEFDCNTSILTKFGFLSIQTGGSKRKPCSRYGFLHKSFQEFFSAFYLAFQILNGEIDCDSVVSDERYWNELKQVFLFMNGILASQCEETTVSLIKSVTVHKYLLGKDLQFVFDCIRECVNFNENLHPRLICILSDHLSHSTVLELFYEFRDMDLVVDALAVNSSLTHLDFSGYKIGGSGVACLSQALKANLYLTNLNLRDNGIGSSGAVSLSEALKANSTLTDLNLRGNEIGYSGSDFLFCVLTANSSVTALDLSNNGTDLETFRAPSHDQRVNISLTKLDLSDNKIGTSGADSLSKVLTFDNCLSYLNMGTNRIGSSGAVSLSKALSVHNSLTYLKLSANQIDESGAACLAEALKVNTCLTDLILGGNKIGDSGAAYLSEALKVNNCLTKLDLMANRIGDSGASSLSEALKVNTCLTYLELDKNRIGDSGAAFLSEALTVNTCLTGLILLRNVISVSGAALLSEALTVNSSLTTLDLRLNKFKDTDFLHFHPSPNMTDILAILDI